MASGIRSFDLEGCIERLYQGQIPTEETIRQVCQQLKKLIGNIPNVVSLRSPLTIAGDLHGHFWELLEIFRIGGFIPDTNYLFLGNYIGLGKFSLQTLLLLFCLKLRHPDRLTLLRGSHECRSMARIYGLYGECLRHYGNTNSWRHLTDVFEYLPLAAVIDESRLCVSSGLSPALDYVDQMKVLNRFTDPPPKSPLADLLWNTPSETIALFQKDPKTGMVSYGHEALNRFLQMNNLKQMIRSNTLCLGGYKESWAGKLITVWSVPNFCDRLQNNAAIIELDGDSLSFTTFSAPPSKNRLTFDVLATDAYSHPVLLSDPAKELPDFLL